MRWFWFLRPKPKPSAALLAMRLDEMTVFHANTDCSHVCAFCNNLVGLYPSGQKVLRDHHPVTIICNNCWPVAVRTMIGKATPRPAAGALEELNKLQRP